MPTPNPKYKTERTSLLTGPALITYAYARGGEPITGEFHKAQNPENSPLLGPEVVVKEGLFVPDGAKLTIRDPAPLITYQVID